MGSVNGGKYNNWLKEEGSILQIPAINYRYLYKKRSKFVKNEHARYTLGMKKGKNLERLITATSQTRF